jgi:hypothetical protein
MLSGEGEKRGHTEGHPGRYSLRLINNREVISGRYSLRLFVTPGRYSLRLINNREVTPGRYSLRLIYNREVREVTPGRYSLRLLAFNFPRSNL